MPYKSKAQARLFFAKEKKGELPKGKALEWAHKTKSIKDLPDHVKKVKDLPEHIKKASDLLEFVHYGQPGHIFKVATHMENADATIDQMLEPSWEQRNNPYMDQPGGFNKYRTDGGPRSTFSQKIKKDIVTGAVTGAGAAVASIPVRHLINPSTFTNRKSMIKHLALGTVSGAAAGSLFASADQARERLNKQASDNTNKESALMRSLRGGVLESAMGAGGALVEAPISKFVFGEKVNLSKSNLLKRTATGASVGALMGLIGGAAGVYGDKKQDLKIDSEHKNINALLAKKANDVHNTSDGTDFLGSDKDPAETLGTFQRIASVKPSYPMVSDGDGASDKLNGSNVPGGQTSV